MAFMYYFPVLKNNNIVVFGIGRVGLPLALVLADKGFDVSGIDVDPARVTALENKKMPFLEEGADELLQKHIGKKFKIFTSDHIKESLAENKYIILTLGTPIDNSYSPDHSQIEKLFLELAPFLEKGHVIILRSTISPGSLRQLARFVEENTKFKVGTDVFMAYCPERIAEGKSVEELGQIPQIIGTLDPESAKYASKVFSKITKIIHYSKPEAAELSKLFCNMYRYIDFAIGNEFMMIAEDYGCDIYEVLNLVNNGYKRAGLKSPGLTAGPCLVKDGFFLIDKSPFMELVMASWRLNENIPGYLFKRIKAEVGNVNGKKVAILGLAFKKNIDDSRFSLVPKFAKYFAAEGAKVSITDPLMASDPLDKSLKNADIIVIGANHDVYKKLSLKNIKKVVEKGCLVCDIWNIFETGKIVFKLSEIKTSS